MSNEIARFNPKQVGQMTMMVEYKNGNYVNYEDYFLLLAKHSAVMDDLKSLRMIPKSEHDELVEKLAALSKSAFEEGLGRGYSNGLSDGQSYSHYKRNDDSESEWEDSESKALLEANVGKIQHPEGERK